MVDVPVKHGVDEPFGSGMVFHITAGTYHLVSFTSKEVKVNLSGKIYLPHIFYLLSGKQRTGRPKNHNNVMSWTPHP